MWQGYGAGRSALCCGAGTGGCEIAPWDDAVLSSLIWVHQLDHWSLWMLAGSALLMDFAHDRLCPHCCKPLWQATRPWVGACLLPTMGHCNSETEGPVLGTHRWDTWGPSPAFRRSVCTGVKWSGNLWGLGHPGVLTQFKSHSRGRSHTCITLTSGTRQTERVPGWQCEFVLFFPAFAFLASVSKQSFWGQRQFCSMGWNLLGGLFDCFGREKHPSIHFPLQSKLKCFLVPPIGVMRKHSHCQSPLQWQSSPSWQAQACCFTNLPGCPVMVVSYGRLSSCKGIAAVLIMFLVALFQRPPALQIGLEHCWSVAYSEAGWLCPVVQMWLLQRLSRAGRAGQSDLELPVPSRGTWRGYPKLTSLGVCLMCNG